LRSAAGKKFHAAGPATAGLLERTIRGINGWVIWVRVLTGLDGTVRWPCVAGSNGLDFW